MSQEAAAKDAAKRPWRLRRRRWPLRCPSWRHQCGVRPSDRPQGFWICLPDIREFPKVSFFLLGLSKRWDYWVDHFESGNFAKHVFQGPNATCKGCDYPKENRNRPHSKVCPAHTSLINCQGSWFWPMVTPRPGLVHPLDIQKRARISATSLLVVQWANDGVLHWGIHQLAWERGKSASARPFRNQKKNMFNEAGHTWQFFHFLELDK